MTKKSMSYEDAGVSIERGNELVQRIKPDVAKTRRPGVMSGIGGFGALFDLSELAYKQPVLVSGTDGVGTKLKLAIESGRHDTIGIDLVAMCVNDLLVQGAEPLFFLDYYACSALNIDNASDVIKGIAQGCEIAGCALVGGETAEMPGMYHNNDYDLAGFCVGVVEKDQVIDGSNIGAGDSIIALPSSGPHSNGYSLIRKIINDNQHSFDLNIDGQSLIEHLLKPTRIYASPILQLIKTCNVKGLAHITGGGLLENIPRVLPENTAAQISADKLQLPTIFQWLQEQGNIDNNEMYRTFNCGIGMVIIVAATEEEKVMAQLHALNEQAWKIGQIINSDAGSSAIEIM